MTFLLDVNLLIAIVDPLHVHHELALDWFERDGHEGWATSPIIQNGVIRIVGAPSYSNVSVGCAEMAETLEEWCAMPNHQFWPDDVSVLDRAVVDRAKLGSAKRITDTYLLALAVAHGGRLATLDRRISTAAVREGTNGLHIIA